MYGGFRDRTELLSETKSFGKNLLRLLAHLVRDAVLRQIEHHIGRLEGKLAIRLPLVGCSERVCPLGASTGGGFLELLDVFVLAAVLDELCRGRRVSDSYNL